ncbi:MAG TPA: ATP-binding protein, partial [Flavisolibacter sp.]
LDENGYIQNWNKGAEKIKGYKDFEIIGKSFQVFYLPEDRENGLPFKLITQAKEKDKAIHEGWRLRKDGTKFWGSIVLTALHNEANEVIGFSKVTRDLTERKITEDKLHEYTSQLQFQNEQLEQFAYAASHDMKEPLRKILFYNNHLLETISENLQEKEAEYLRRSINAARRMERLINDLLEYSKAASDMHGFESVDLNEIVDETLLTYKEAIEEKKAKVQVSKLPRVNGIPFQLRQVFDNLISNALKYNNPAKNPLITIESEKVAGAEVKGLLTDREYHKIEVCDNGIGFDAEYAEKIFDLFQRLGSVKYSGTGVGLALCKRIAQNHHGIIKAQGSAGNGACFKVYLPA